MILQLLRSTCQKLIQEFNKLEFLYVSQDQLTNTYLRVSQTYSWKVMLGNDFKSFAG